MLLPGKLGIIAFPPARVTQHLVSAVDLFQVLHSPAFHRVRHPGQAIGMVKVSLIPVGLSNLGRGCAGIDPQNLVVVLAFTHGSVSA
jgi:hypothetical protein